MLIVAVNKINPSGGTIPLTQVAGSVQLPAVRVVYVCALVNTVENASVTTRMNWIAVLCKNVFIVSSLEFRIKELFWVNILQIAMKTDMERLKQTGK